MRILKNKGYTRCCKVYEKQLREEINKDREGHGKAFDDDRQTSRPKKGRN